MPFCNLLQVDRMVQQGAGAEEVMAYLVLVRGTSARRKGLTTHGANSVATRSSGRIYSWFHKHSSSEEVFCTESSNLNLTIKSPLPQIKESGYPR
jgi:hypothetical protein